MSTKIIELRTLTPSGDVGAQIHTIILRIDGHKKHYRCTGRTLQEAIKDAYFYHTGKVANIPEKFDSPTGPVFTEDLADPEEFAHLERVPEFLEPPF